MSTVFGNLARRRGASLLKHAFAERTPHGDFAEVTGTLPGGKPIKLTGVIVGQLRVSDEIENQFGAEVRDQIEDVIELHIPVEQNNGFEPLTETALDIPNFPGESFTLLEVLSHTPTFSHVRCSRKHITRLQSNIIEN